MNLFDVCFSFVLDCAAMSSVVFCCLVLDKNIIIFITANCTAAKELKNMCKLNLFYFYHINCFSEIHCIIQKHEYKVINAIMYKLVFMLSKKIHGSLLRDTLIGNLFFLWVSSMG